MTPKFAVLVASLLIWSSAADAQCRGAGTPGAFGSSEYLYCGTEANWKAAQVDCATAAVGWTLTRVDDSGEDGFIRGLGAGDLWIGGDDLTVDGVWRWRDGDQFWQGDDSGKPVGGLYSNWSGGQPNAGADEDCTRMKGDGTWEDRKCIDTEFYVCEGPPFCGSGARGAKEECDDGNIADGDGCSSKCTLEGPPPCGDGLIWLGEECDDGNALGGDGCSSTCQVEPGYTCLGTPSVCQLAAHVLVGRVELLEVRGEPLLQWETTSQSGTLGFVVSRRGREGWEPLHEGILLALPGAAQGGVYSLRDTGASTRRPVRYRLEEIEIDGARKPIGEWQLVARPASAPVLSEGDYDAVAHELVPRRVERSIAFAHKSDASGPASRVVLDIEQSGAVEVSVSALAELFGQSPSEVRSWALTGNVRITDQAYQVPWWFDEASDNLVVVGRSPTSVYSATRPYVVRNATGRQMPVERRETPATPVGMGTTRHLVDSNAFPALVVSPDPESDYWFAASLSARASGFGQYQTEIVLPDAAVEAAVLRADLYGGWNLSDETAQRVVIHVNGVPVGTVEVAAIGPHTFEVPVDPEVLRAGNNQLLLVAESDVPPAVSGLYVDRFELELDRELTTAQSELEFTALVAGPLTIEVAASSAQVLDTTDQKRIGATVVTDAEFGFTSVSFETEQDHSYVVFESPSAPSSIRGTVDLDMPPDGASYLVITPAAWTNAAQRFASLHAAEGLSSAVVSIESLYDAYGHSVATPHAVHDFLVDAEAQWVVKPRFVLLLGDGTIDYRSLVGIGPGAIAPRMVQTKGGLYASDALLGDLDDDGHADVAVGRIPAQTADEAMAAFEALQRYQELEFADFGLAALMISGVNRGASFTGAIDSLQQMLPPVLETRSIPVDALGVEQARAELAIDLQRAPYWMHYTGHGGLDRFDDEGVLKTEDIPLLQPLLPPIVTGMTCATSRFELPGVDALAEHMVDPAHAFAIASWGPSGLTMTHDAAKLGEAFATKLFSEDGATPRLGDLIVALHQETAPAYDRNALAVYVLLGDPALRLKSAPEGSIVAPPSGPNPIDPTRTPGGSATPSPASGAGCAVHFSRNGSSPLWLVLALLWFAHRRWRSPVTQRTSPANTSRGCD